MVTVNTGIFLQIKKLEAKDFGFYRKMMIIAWMEHMRHKEVLRNIETKK